MLDSGYTVYILHSTDLDRYYVGFTSMDLADRIRRHNTNHKGFTGRAQDWDVVYSTVISDKRKALKLEKKIKSRGARRYLKDADE